MKTAVIISGQMRTFSRVLPGLKYYLFRKLPEPTFFVSAADDEDAKSIEDLRLAMPDSQVFSEVVAQPTLPEPPEMFAAHAPYDITPTRTPGVGPFQGILRQLWHLSRAWKFYIAECSKGLNEGDAIIPSHHLIVRLRPDLRFAKFELPFSEAEMESGRLSAAAFVPWWGGYGGVNDRFALLGAGAAQSYFKTYDTLSAELIPEGCPFHPESLVQHSLRNSGVNIRRELDAEFAFLRKPDAQHPGYWSEHMQPLWGEVAAWSAFCAARQLRGET